MSQEIDALAGLFPPIDASLSDAVAALASGERVDFASLAPGAVALLVARAREATRTRFVFVCADNESARRAASDFRLFSGGEVALVFPEPDTSPFAEVAPDRRTGMERLATLFHLAAGLDWSALAAPLSAFARRVPPRDAILRRSMIVKAEDELDRERLIEVLTEGGYLRVPVVEDPGTFAVRGALIDIYAPRAVQPARIELDDWLVLSIKRFDPDDQRTSDSIDTLHVHPVRDALYGPEELASARVKIRDRCDAFNIPTRAARQLLDELDSGRLHIGIDNFLPAFFDRLESLREYLPDDAKYVVIDPTASASYAEESISRAERDYEARVGEKKPTFELADYLLERDGIEEQFGTDLALVHRVAVGGATAEEEGSFSSFLSAPNPLRLGAEDQTPLTAELKARRATQGRDDALRPLADRTRAWLDAGLRVIFAARTHAQADRLVSLLKQYEVPVASKVDAFSPSDLQGGRDQPAIVRVGQLSSGFVWPSVGIALVTEEEVFGARSHRRRASASKKKGRGKKGRAFVEDLRQLAVGDFVVHVDHGIGRYQGLERKSLQVSLDERMRGVEGAQVEVLVVEYAKGDKLFLPVTRLHQIQKFSGGEGAAPKLDRLGGQTFSKTKAKVRKHVKQMAEELLRLYAERLAHERPPLPTADRAYAEFEATFPFEETSDQLNAIEDVLNDLEQKRPMDRIVCGDVGFGKTEVALRAAFRVAMEGRQVAVLCPTTVLAQQHFNTFADRMRNYPLRVEVLSRFVDRKEQGKVLAQTKEGKVDVLVGTHRLLSKDVHFQRLGLLVVDEEQRFGVTHKERIKKLKSEVDVLTLTATPIPRTLQLAVGGLRDLSLITTAPVDRRAVRTLVTRWDEHLVREAILRELSRGGQAFFIYNRIEGLYERARLLKQLIPEGRFAVAHGQMGEAELERTMTDFVDGAYDVLCSTAIVESGLDIPRANTMLIDRADTFGLAQLYQLRGRVGRSKERAYCYLVTPPPAKMTDEARARIQALERFSHLGAGFSVASLDMELRGAGDVLGSEQSGNVSSVGFDLFLHMLEEAVAELRGEPVVHDVDTELSLDLEHYLPDSYIEDVGLRLSFYKRLASAESENEVVDLASEMEDRFGPPPEPANQLVRAMRVKPRLRNYKVLGCEASRARVVLHLREDTPLDPAKVMAKVGSASSDWKLSPDMRLTRRFEPTDPGDSLDRVEALLSELGALRRSA